MLKILVASTKLHEAIFTHMLPSPLPIHKHRSGTHIRSKRKKRNRHRQHVQRRTETPLKRENLTMKKEIADLICQTIPEGLDKESLSVRLQGKFKMSTAYPDAVGGFNVEEALAVLRGMVHLADLSLTRQNGFVEARESEVFPSAITAAARLQQRLRRRRKRQTEKKDLEKVKGNEGQINNDNLSGGDGDPFHNDASKTLAIKLFHAMDVNHDGNLSKKEVLQATTKNVKVREMLQQCKGQSFGSLLSPAAWRATFRTLDMDANGKVSQEEFLKAWVEGVGGNTVTDTGSKSNRAGAPVSSSLSLSRSEHQQNRKK